MSWLSEQVNPLKRSKESRTTDVFKASVGLGYGGKTGNVFDPAGLNSKDNQKVSNNADKLNARITRESWEDYKKRFYPIEQEQIASLTPEARAAAMDKRMVDVDKSVDTQYGVARGITDRGIARLGLKPTADQQESMDRKFDTGAGLQKIGLQNATRTAAMDRDENMMLNTIQTGRDVAAGASTSAASAAQLGLQRKAAQDQLDAQERAQTTQDVGTAASLAYLAYLAW
jgi:hypothetical protein